MPCRTSHFFNIFLMIRNYFNLALRNLLRKKAYAFINIIGLATGVAFCLLPSIYLLASLLIKSYA